MKKTVLLLAAIALSVSAVCAATISVTQPAGGSFALGAACPVHWTVTGVSGNVKIQLIKPGGALVGLLVSGLAANSSPWPWTVAGPAVAGTSYRIRVSAIDNSTIGESATFSITAAPAMALTVIQPNAANVSLCLNDPSQIKWTAVGVTQKVQLLLVKTGGVTVGTIAQNLDAGSSPFNWTNGKYNNNSASAPEALDYKICVRTMDNAVEDSSDNAFKLKTCAATKPVFTVDREALLIPLTVQAPKTGDYWYGGTSETIRWETILKQPLKIELYNHNGTDLVRKIADSLSIYPMNGKWKYAWNIPTDISPAWYQVKVSVMAGSNHGFSAKFFVRQKISDKTYVLPAAINNMHKSRTKIKKEFFVGAKIFEDPGAGKMRVGYNGSTGDTADYAVIYRSYAAFGTSAYKGKGFLLKAKLSFKRYGGCSTPIKVYVLESAWNGDAEALFAVSCSHVPNPDNVTQIVQGWLAHPESNHGFVFVGPDESMTYADGECVGYYQDVKLELEFLSSE